MAQAGIELSLPEVSVKSVADKLGVSIVAIYNNVDGAEALKSLIAEEILRRWMPPSPSKDQCLDDALLELSQNLRGLVHENPGIAHYLATVDATSRTVLVKIDAVQTVYRQIYGFTPKQTSWMVSTVSQHAIAIAEHIHFRGRQMSSGSDMQARKDLNNLPDAVSDKDRTHDDYFVWSMRTTIVGAQILIRDPDFDSL